MNIGFQDDGQLRAGNYGRLDAGKQMGGQAVRLIMSRQRAERGQGGKGGYDFSQFDNIVNNARQRGLQVQMVLDNLEGFKNHGSGDPKKYAAFVKAAGQHFDGRVARWSLGNEPDLKMNPQKYRNLYQQGYRALKKTDPSAKVLFGELSPNGGMDYAYRVLTAGNKPLRAAGLAIHPYQNGDPMAPGDFNGMKWGIGRAGQMQKLLKAFRKNQGFETRTGHTPGLYFTEFGYDTRPKPVDGAPAPPPDGYGAGGAPQTRQGVTDEQAAAWWPRAVRKAQDAGVRQMVAYTLTGSPGSTWDTGLTNFDGTPRPAYTALAGAIRAGQLKKKG